MNKWVLYLMVLLGVMTTLAAESRFNVAGQIGTWISGNGGQ